MNGIGYLAFSFSLAVILIAIGLAAIGAVVNGIDRALVRRESTRWRGAKVIAVPVGLKGPNEPAPRQVRAVRDGADLRVLTSRGDVVVEASSLIEGIRWPVAPGLVTVEPAECVRDLSHGSDDETRQVGMDVGYRIGPWLGLADDLAILLSQTDPDRFDGLRLRWSRVIRSWIWGALFIATAVATLAFQVLWWSSTTARGVVVDVDPYWYECLVEPLDEAIPGPLVGNCSTSMPVGTEVEIRILAGSLPPETGDTGNTYGALTTATILALGVTLLGAWQTRTRLRAERLKVTSKLRSPGPEIGVSSVPTEHPGHALEPRDAPQDDAIPPTDR